MTITRTTRCFKTGTVPGKHCCAIAFQQHIGHQSRMTAIGLPPKFRLPEGGYKLNRLEGTEKWGEYYPSLPGDAAPAIPDRISLSFALTRAAFSAPMRISIFCPAERASSSGSAYR